jgi:hypothetical protein
MKNIASHAELDGSRTFKRLIRLAAVIYWSGLYLVTDKFRKRSVLYIPFACTHGMFDKSYCFENATVLHARNVDVLLVFFR